MSRILSRVGILALSTAMVTGTGCKSAWVNVKVENQTGEAIRELEVDYPTASFGFDGLAAGAEKQYRLKVRGHGPVSVMYTLPNGQIPRAKGPDVTERETGEITIVLLPGGKVDFNSRLQPAT